MIIFKTIRWKNILSTGNIFTEITLNKYKNTLIVGENGSGKSTMLDALCFALFGKPFRKINKPNIINSINQKDAVVELDFDIGKKVYKIVRGLKPNIFEIYCDETLLNQEAKSIDYQEYLERNILKINFKSFTQIVILGSASFVPFMQLSASDRRLIIEDLLDIQVFSSMNALAKTRLAEIKETIQKNKFQIDLLSEKISMQKKHIDTLKQNKDEKIEIHKESNIKDQQRIAEYVEQIDLMRTELADSTLLTQEKLNQENKKKKLLSLEGSIDSNIKKNKKLVSFFEENDKCPTCLQSIDSHFKEEQNKSLEDKREEYENAMLELESRLLKLDESLVTINDQITDSQKKQAKINHLHEGILVLNSEILKRLNEIQKLQDLHDSSNEEIRLLEDLEKKLSEKENENKEEIEDRSYYEAAAILLKDSGIKTKIIKQYLPIINKLVNKYLSSLDFFVNFNLDESFKESIKSRHRDEFSYESFSEGEKQRIDMALMLTWRSVAKLKSSINTNLLILDEIFDSSLDANGTEELIQILHELENTNLFVISHKSDQLIEKFDQTIKFSKVKNFSRMQV
jgi:DNA repair exonuclease SbcCD ATPase subunit